MPRPYSLDLRQRIVAECDAGVPVQDVARKFGVVRRTVYNLLEHRSRTGSLEPIQGRAGRKSKLTEYKPAILKTLEQSPLLTLQDLIALLKLQSSISALSKALKQWDIVLKKR